MQPLFARSSHDDFQLFDVSADGIDRVILCCKPRYEIVVEFQVDVAEVEPLAFRLAELVELNDKPFVVLNCRCSVAQLVDIESCTGLHFVRITDYVVGQRFPTAYAAAA